MLLESLLKVSREFVVGGSRSRLAMKIAFLSLVALLRKSRTYEFVVECTEVVRGREAQNICHMLRARNAEETHQIVRARGAEYVLDFEGAKRRRNC